MMDRRAFLATVGVGVTAAPRAGEAQQAGKVYRVGVLSPVGSPAANAPYMTALKAGLRELGWIEGRSITFEEQYPAGKLELLPNLAEDLVRRQVDVIITVAVTPTRILMRATTAIPIVMAPAADAVEMGLVTSLSRPGGNVTGVSYPTSALSAKGLEFLKEAIPKAIRVGVLFNPSLPLNYAVLRDVQVRAQTLLLGVVPLEVRTRDEFETVLSKIQPANADALLVVLDPFTFVHAERIVELASKHGLPTLFGSREPTIAGGLMSYGPNVVEMYRRAVSRYVDQLLRGAKPADLPVEQPATFELVINLKTARTLGLTIPQSLLVRADHLIQ